MLARRSLVPSRLWPTDLLAEMDRMMRRVEEAFAGLMPRTARPRSQAEEVMWLPRCEIHQTDDTLEISFEVPGVPKENIEVETTAEELTVRGERKVSREECPEEGVCASEFVYGAFERTIAWPLPVKHEEAKARYENGVLTVTVPLAEEAKAPEAKKVEVE